MLMLLGIAVVDPVPAWEKEVVYQIFPRSFRDSDGDHVGDLRGITDELATIQRLGVTAVLLNPVLASRTYHNYFPDDFTKVDPTMGANAQFFELVRAAHRRHMKIILDMEVQYVGDRHPWYAAIQQGAASPYSGYLWRKGSGLYGGTIPSYNGERIGFATVDPDNPKVLDELKKVFLFWSAPNGRPEEGVDGFRIDHMMDDLDWQHKRTNMLQNFWLPIETAVRTAHPASLFLAEQADWGWGADHFAKADVDAVFAFPLRWAISTLTPNNIVAQIRAARSVTPAAKDQFLFIENHDMARFATVVDNDPRLLRIGAVLNLTLKGTPILYYGQELGTPGKQGQWFSDGNDIPVRLAYRWNKAPAAPGTADWYRGSGPWTNPSLRAGDGMSLEEQAADPRSLYSFYRRLIALRLTTPALREGAIDAKLSPNPSVLEVVRSSGRDRVVILVNFADDEAAIPVTTEVLGLSHSMPLRDLVTGSKLPRGTNTVNVPAKGFLILGCNVSAGSPRG